MLFTRLIEDITCSYPCFLQRGSPDWKALVDDAEERYCLFSVESSLKVRSVLSIGLTNDTQSPAKDPRSKNKHISAQVRDSHGSSSSSNDYGVHQIATPIEVSCCGSAVERNKGQVQPVSSGGREPSATAERRARTSAAEMASKPLPGNGQRNGHAAESGKIIVNSSHSTSQEQEKHGKEEVRYRDRHQEETKKVPRHRPKSNDHLSNPHRHENRNSRKRDHHHKNHHRRDQNNYVPVESKSNYTQGVYSRHHSSHHDRDSNRDRDYDPRDRDHRDHERVEGSAFQGRQMEPGQNSRSPDIGLPATTSTSLDENEVSNENEIHYGNGLEIDTQDPHFISLIENNEPHKKEYFVKLRQQERQHLRKTAASPAENGRSPAERERSPAEHEFTSAKIKFSSAKATATLTRVPNPGSQPRVQTTVTKSGLQYRSETTVSTVPIPGVSRRVETTASRVPNPGIQPRFETTVSRVPNSGIQPRFETTISEAPNLGVSDTPNPLPSRITQHRSSSYSSAAPLPSTSNATHSNALSRRPSGAGSDSSQPSTSLGSRSLDRRIGGEIDEGAQRALDIVRSRCSPTTGPPVIPAMWNPFGGSRKRQAHADTGDVSLLRQKASGSASSQLSVRRTVGRSRNRIQEKKKNYEENFRGRKNWK